MRTLLALSLLICSSSAFAWWFGEKTYEECVADATSITTPKRIAGTIQMACEGDAWSESESNCVIKSLSNATVDRLRKLQLTHAVVAGLKM